MSRPATRAPSSSATGSSPPSPCGGRSLTSPPAASGPSRPMRQRSSQSSARPGRVLRLVDPLNAPGPIGTPHSRQGSGSREADRGTEPEIGVSHGRDEIFCGRSADSRSVLCKPHRFSCHALYSGRLVTWRSIRYVRRGTWARTPAPPRSRSGARSPRPSPGCARGPAPRSRRAAIPASRARPRSSPAARPSCPHPCPSRRVAVRSRRDGRTVPESSTRRGTLTDGGRTARPIHRPALSTSWLTTGAEV